MQIETQMIETVPVVRFDWALKHLLRDEKNIPLFNDFLTALFPRKVEVVEILKSDYADDEPNDCYGKLNLLARYTNGEVFVVNLVAICSDRFMPIFLNLSARAVQDNNLSKGEERQIYPVVSVAIVYSAQDDSMAQVDCVFYGKTGFEGAPWEEPLLLKDSLCYNPNRVRKASAFFPQYYVLKLQDFRNYCARHLDHWIRMMAYCEWYVDSPIPGIDQAGELLAVNGFDLQSHLKYCHDAEGRLASVYEEVVEPAYREGYELGRKQGTTMRLISSSDSSDKEIARAVGLTEEEVAQLRVEVEGEGEGSKD